MNRPGGYWIASIDPDASNHMQRRSVKIKVGDRILLASDGLLEARRFNQKLSWIDAISEKVSIEDILDRLRAAERDDPDGIDFPRLKTSDDATGLLLEIALG